MSNDDRTNRGPRGDRRRVLRGVCAAGTVGLLAGCLGDGTSDGDSADDGDPADDTTGDDDPADETASFTVLSLAPDGETLTRGEAFAVSAGIENGTTAAGTQDVELRLDGETVESVGLDLDGGESTTVEFEERDTLEHDPGEYGYEVATDDDSASATLTIESILGDDPDPLLVFEADDIALESGTQTVSATLENPYQFAAEDGAVSLALPDGWDVADESGTSFEAIDSEGSQDVEWDLEVPDDAAGDYDLAAEVTYTVAGEEATATVTQPAYLPVDAAETVTYRWELDEGEGETATDSVSGLEMVLDAPEWQSGAGLGDSYLAFDGDGDRGVAAYQEDFDGLDAITVNIWLRTDDADPDDYNNVVAVNSSSGTTSVNDLAWNVAHNAGTGYLDFRLADGDAGYGDSDLESGADGIAPSDYADGEWHMITCVWDGDAERHELYLDGALTAEVTTTVSSMDTVEEELTIGATQDGGRPTDGDIDAVEIAPDEAWRPAEIANRYDELQGNY